MNKVLSFAAGAMCGAVVGAAVVLLVAPSAGVAMKEAVEERLRDVVRESRQAKEETQKRMEAEYGRLLRD